MNNQQSRRSSSPTLAPPRAFRSPHLLAGRDDNAPVLLALSGGMDSRVLLHLLADDAKTRGYPLHLVHLHHGIRGSEADLDESFCRRLALLYHLPLYVIHADVPALAEETGESLEMAGRRARYDAFAQVMREHSIPLLATAHHANDNTETLLLRLSTGCTTSGLGGIAPARPFANGTLVRPLLHVTHREIADFCLLHALEHVTDSTNENRDYLRNRLRADVIPSLEEIAPHSHRQILRTCASLREDDEYLCSLADGLLKNALTSDGALTLKSLNDAPSPLRKRAVVRWVRGHAPLLRLQSCHVDALCDLIDTGRGKTCLPDGWSAAVQSEVLRLRFDRDQSLPPAPPCEWRTPLAVGSVCTDFGVHLTLTQRGEIATDAMKNAKNPQNVYNTFIRDTLSFDTIVQDAYFRPRAAGDLLLLRGMHRKVRKLQNQAGIPPALRHRLPVLCDERGVLWVPFVGVRDDFPVVPPESAEYLLTLSVDAPLISCL